MYFTCCAGRDRKGEVRGTDNKGGSIWLWSGDKDKTYVFPFLSAVFGKPLSKVPRKVVAAYPDSLCDPKDFQGDGRGAILVARRGGCSFTDKAIVAMKVGAKAILVINSDEGMLRMPAAEGMAPVNIEAAMYVFFFNFMCFMF